MKKVIDSLNIEKCVAIKVHRIRVYLSKYQIRFTFYMCVIYELIMI